MCVWRGEFRSVVACCSSSAEIMWLDKACMCVNTCMCRCRLGIADVCAVDDISPIDIQFNFLESANNAN